MALDFIQDAHFIFGQVMHKRMQPKINQFKYKIFYIALPLSKINKEFERRFFKYNRFGLLSFYEKDHGYRNDTSLSIWVEDVFNHCKKTKPNGEIVLVTMPRVLGYVFNPVSFFYCYDKNENLCAVICEVNNTFGETHSYLCLPPSHQNKISHDDVLEGQKIFHVSPFIERIGKYKFRFSQKDEGFGVWIDLIDDNNMPFLLTAVTGKMAKLNKENILKAFFLYPLVTFKAIFLIHWQAIKLLLKGIKYIPKPLQSENKITHTITQINLKDKK